MGQKVHPTGIRLGIAKDWNSTWYADKGEYAEQLKSDLMVREYLQTRLAQAAVSRIQIERPAKSARITIHTARPGIVIGKKGEDIESLRRDSGRESRTTLLRRGSWLTSSRASTVAMLQAGLRAPSAGRAQRNKTRRKILLTPTAGLPSTPALNFSRLSSSFSTKIPLRLRRLLAQALIPEPSRVTTGILTIPSAFHRRRSSSF